MNVNYNVVFSRIGITNSADCLAYCVMTGLLWPNRAGQYLLLAGIHYGGKKSFFVQLNENRDSH